MEGPLRVPVARGRWSKTPADSRIRSGSRRCGPRLKNMAIRESFEQRHWRTLGAEPALEPEATPQRVWVPLVAVQWVGLEVSQSQP